MNPPDKPCQATPAGDLRQQIIDSRVPKNEREWWASREIEKLERELAAAKAECERLKFALVEWEAKERGWSKAVEKDAAELTRLRAELEVANHSIVSSLLYNTLKETNARLRAELASKTACYDIACGEVQRLRAEVERWELAFQEQYARAEKAEAELAAEREKVLVGSVALIEVKMERAKLRTENAELWRDRSADGETYKTIGELRAEVERLKGALALGQQNCDDAYDDLREERDEAIAKREQAESELANIANAKPDTWGDMSDSFQAWAQNRARHALAAMKGTP